MSWVLELADKTTKTNKKISEFEDIDIDSPECNIRVKRIRNKMNHSINLNNQL